MFTLHLCACARDCAMCALRALCARMLVCSVVVVVVVLLLLVVLGNMMLLLHLLPWLRLLLVAVAGRLWQLWFCRCCLSTGCLVAGMLQPPADGQLQQQLI